MKQDLLWKIKRLMLLLIVAALIMTGCKREEQTGAVVGGEENNHVEENGSIDVNPGVDSGTQEGSGESGDLDSEIESGGDSASLTTTQLFELRTCSYEDLFVTAPMPSVEHSVEQAKLTISVPKQQLSGIQAITTRKLYDDAGYGSLFGTSIALNDKGQVYAWGLRFDVWDYKYATPFPVLVEGLPKIASIAGEFGLTADGNVWFTNGVEQPFRIEGLSNVASITEFNHDMLAAVTKSGQLWLWFPEWGGREETLLKVDAAVDVIAAFGDQWGLIYWIDRKGNVWYTSVDWQFNVKEPQKIDLPAGEQATRVETTFAEDYILTKKGQVYQINDKFGVALLPLDQVRRIVGDYNELLYLRDDGTVWRVENQLHRWEDRDFWKRMERIEGLDQIVDLQRGMDHVLALAEDGTVYTWGSNMFGQLGRYPHYYDRFTKLGELPHALDLRPSYTDISFIRDGDVWLLDQHMAMTPVLLGQDIVKSLYDVYLSADGTMIINDGIDTCYRLLSRDGIADVLQANNGWIVKLHSGELYQVNIRNAQLGFSKQVRFAGETQPAVKEMFKHPLFMVLTEDGKVYYQSKETEDTIWMEAIHNLPFIEQWSVLDYVFFDMYGYMVRALDDQGNAYQVKVTREYREHNQRWEIEGTDFELERIAQHVKRLYGGLLELDNGRIIDTGLRPHEPYVAGQSYPVVLDGPLSSPIDAIYSWYSYHIEGPTSFRHVLIAEDGSLYLYGHNPFFSNDSTPAPVLIR